MDFIFGEATAFFRDSEIRSLGDRAISYTLAPSTHYRSRHGFVFERCRFTNGREHVAQHFDRDHLAARMVQLLERHVGPGAESAPVLRMAEVDQERRAA